MIRAPDDWDDVPDDELEETILERIEGMSEMVPQSVRKAVTSTTSWTIWTVKSTFGLARNTAWIVATSSLVMFLPYIIEKERSDMERSQVLAQQQMLLGPHAAIQNAKKQ
ncbi:hypothetical protein WR25_00719 [Diploscapter pachys]|uniref:Mitochondrial import receptor subunit TOM22 homolog n=1 Tax=Diploscapter pachys TaxID=2018661 RepID=A0A2A2LEI6_9BILA|nr:hypothetical protein WR25_00719 [Diploscapter pachys]